MDNRLLDTEIMTPAGQGRPVRRNKLATLRREVPNFIAKNRGLLGQSDFWSMMRRVAAMRMQAQPSTTDAPVRFVATHHKVMTTYFTAVLKPLSIALKLPYQIVHSEQPDPKSRLVMSMHGKLNLPALGKYRGVHVMRDPRDMIVSGYHYHKWTHETWVHRPDDDGVSYQEKLNRADKRDGLFLEIDHFIFFYRQTLLNWNLDDPDIYEVAYDDLMGPERDRIYSEIFAHLGFDGEALALSTDLMRLFEAGSRSGKASGEVTAKSHLRSGKSGQWQKELEDDHVAYIEKELGPVLRKFGY
ncbi:sulfotransferase domain-containing protein [Pseudoruegeria sp. HB172150]|uniref:sulfotransferase domain-containing protein n=1 Tax=Pseudoruegeria sp. HB172150 TaxID=2721164 RepID=UPI00155721FC|nr:sulfotransferase domain-containing protein [Pseudoruegeria sp. HB172150]